MTLQNRVTPFSEIVAVPERGMFMGNRGVLHGEGRALGRARWRGRRWIVCRLEPRGAPRVPMTPGRYTELFFLDEATALAAGHRPCAECRREAFGAFVAAWCGGSGDSERPSAIAIDRLLHETRLDGGRQRTHVAGTVDLPMGRWSPGMERPGWWRDVVFGTGRRADTTGLCRSEAAKPLAC